MVSIPGTDANAPGVYTVTADVTTMTTGGETTTTRESPTLMRFVPYFQDRDEPMNATDVETGTISTEAWTNSITAIPGSGTFIHICLAGPSGLESTVMFANQGFSPYRVAFLRSISIMFPDGVARSYNVFRTPASAGVTITILEQLDRRILWQDKFLPQQN